MRKKVFKYSILFIILVDSIIGLSQAHFSVQPVSFNTSEREYAPVYFNNGLVFISTNRNNELLTYIDRKSGKQLSNLYFTPLNKDSFGDARIFSEQLKSSFHEGPITFSEEGDVAYFSRSKNIRKKLKNNFKTDNKVGIFKTIFNGESWEDAKLCSFNSEQFNAGQPSLTKDGSRLYFSSDKAGGYGGKDLYYVEIINGFFGPMVNLGEDVNSEYDEIFPFINNKNKLYFASNRPSSFGGFDIYTCKKLKSNWSEPNPMNNTINSPFDDFAIMFNDEETEGYFSSNKNGSDDIYNVKVLFPEFADCNELINELLCYEFYEESTLNADSVAMIYEWDFGDGVKERSLETYHCFEEPGSYTIELNIMDPIVGATFVNEATYELVIEEVNQPKIIAPDTISINTNFQVLVSKGKWSDFRVDNYYLDYGDSTITKNNNEVHQYKHPGFKELKILISGHDSSTNEIKTNCFYKTIYATSDTTLIASQQQFLNKLKYGGFNTDRLEELNDKVYMLEIKSTSVSILNDTSILKQYTDRVREVYDSKTATYSYVFGETNDAFDLIEDFRNAHKNGFSEALAKVYYEGKIKFEDLELAYDNQSGEVNVVLNHIQFEYDGDLLDEKSKKELRKVIQYLKDHPEVKIEIGAHTDAYRNIEKAKKNFASLGLKYSKLTHDKMSSEYNLELSQRRADSVLDYINKMGINIARLKAKGYGETIPIAPNQNKDGSDNPTGRSKNRRVSFRILSK